MTYITQAREAVISYDTVAGKENVELMDILAVLIGPKSTAELARRIAAIGIKRLIEMSTNELIAEGLTKSQAWNVKAGCLLAKRYRSVGRENQRYTIRSPKSAADLLIPEMSHLEQEHFVVLFLNIKNQVLHKQTVFVGGLNTCTVHPRDIFREALKYSAATVILAHCHPSGIPTPSSEDVEITKRLVKVREIMGIEVLDHLVIADHTFLSMKEKGYMG